MPIPVGTRLGPYEVLGSLGAGGMGEVYRARDTQLQRTVAVKVIAERKLSVRSWRDGSRTKRWRHRP